MHTISYPNYCTRYSAHIDGYTIEFGNNFGRSACYGYSIGYLDRPHNKATYMISLTKDFSDIETGYNNYCWMTKHQLENYLRRISTIKPFKYKVYEKPIARRDSLRIELKIAGTKKEITFVLQCIKRCYEFPFNFYLLQAYKMQELPAFKYDSILNLFNVVFSTFDSHKNYDHCFSGCTKFEKYSTLREKLPYVSQVTSLFPRECLTTKESSYSGIIQRGVYKGTAPCVIEQWGDCFEVFLPDYIKNYKELKR